MKYALQIDITEQLLKGFGTKIRVTRRTRTSFDPATEAATYTTASYDFTGVGLPPGRESDYRVGTLVNRRATEFYLAQKQQTIEPKNGDKIAWKGREMTIFWAQTYDPAADGSILTICYAEE